MIEKNDLADRFEKNRPHLQSVARRLLGSETEAEDAVQEAWFRLNRTDMTAIDNLGGWLTTVVARVCLDALRARKSRREEVLDAEADTAPPSGERAHEIEPERHALLADSVGAAMLVVLDALEPPERLAFVLHDMFAVPFDEIAPIVGKSAEAARQLASRARRRVQGADTAGGADLHAQRQVVDAFLAAARGGDMQALLAVLDPDVVVRSDAASRRPGAPAEVRGAAAVAKRAAVGGARAARPALVNGAVGVVIAPRGRLLMVLQFTIAGDRITAIDAIADRERLGSLTLATLA